MSPYLTFPMYLTFIARQNLARTSYRPAHLFFFFPSHVTILALIKPGPTSEPFTPLASQLPTTFSQSFARDETLYESLHAVVTREL